jgi:hypothetical protein
LLKFNISAMGVKAGSLCGLLKRFQGIHSDKHHIQIQLSNFPFIVSGISNSLTQW